MKLTDVISNNIGKISNPLQSKLINDSVANLQDNCLLNYLSQFGLHGLNLPEFDGNVCKALERLDGTINSISNDFTNLPDVGGSISSDLMSNVTGLSTQLSDVSKDLLNQFKTAGSNLPRALYDCIQLQLGLGLGIPDFMLCNRSVLDASTNTFNKNIPSNMTKYVDMIPKSPISLNKDDVVSIIPIKDNVSRFL